MKKIVIQGGFKLRGSINISGSKNIAVALLPGCLLTDKEVTLYNVPNIEDVNILIMILKKLNVKIYKEKNKLVINTKNVLNSEIMFEEVGLLRGSIYFLGASS